MNIYYELSFFSDDINPSIDLPYHTCDMSGKSFYEELQELENILEIEYTLQLDCFQPLVQKCHPLDFTMSNSDNDLECTCTLESDLSLRDSYQDEDILASSEHVLQLQDELILQCHLDILQLESHQDGLVLQLDLNSHHHDLLQLETRLLDKWCKHNRDVLWLHKYLTLIHGYKYIMEYYYYHVR
jgi:hypothetical protein